MKSVEKYVLDKINSIVDDTGDNFAINNRVKRCLTIINEEKNARASGETKPLLPFPNATSLIRWIILIIGTVILGFIVFS